MKTFEHYNSHSLNAAVSILKEHKKKARVIAGGTDLLGTLKDNIHQDYPDMLVNMKTLQDLSYIKESEDGLKLGAMCRIHEIEKNPMIKGKYSALAEAAHSTASPALRRMGTLGGNICQEPRCWYYRYPENGFFCMRKGGKRCNALTGENQFHSIFGAARVVAPPCSSACPGHVNIPLYMNKIREGDLQSVAQILLENNPIPAITGRVCPHFCEQNCNRGELDDSLSIRGVERFIGDFVLANAGEFIRPPKTETGRSVAVVGSGPAGLSAAYYLRTLGHRVTVFDRNEEAGGMLRYAIPAYRLPKEVVGRTVKAIEGIGVEFKLEVNVGQDVTVNELKENFDHIFIASGAWGQPSIGLEGEAFTKSGLDFLVNINRGVHETPAPRIVVIGGGNVAVDVAISALRLGAEKVTMVCLESQEEMPALPREIEQALEEGVKLMPSWGPKKVLETAGKVQGIELVRCTSVFDQEGCFSPAFDDAVKETMEADQIFLAVGQKTDLSFCDQAMGIEGNKILVDRETQRTNLPGVFAGGDVTTGPASVIEAVAAGKKAAIALNRQLSGVKIKTKKRNSRDENLLDFNRDYLKATPRSRMPLLPGDQRTIDTEDELGFVSGDIQQEANRCFNCGCVAANTSDIGPALLALDAKIMTTSRIVDAGDFFSALPGKSTVLEDDEVVTEIRIPSLGPDSRSTYVKFRLRNSIDFPIVGVAVCLTFDSGKIDDARIVLGAVAPVPLRMREAEAYLRGKEISESVAEACGRLAVKDARSFVKNDYKIQITKAMVKRAILANGE